VRQLLKDDKASKIDLFKNILSAKKKKKGSEKEKEEEEDSKRTKKKMDLSASPSNVTLANPGPWLP
jgi:hypothetical protein